MSYHSNLRHILFTQYLYQKCGYLQLFLSIQKTNLWAKLYFMLLPAKKKKEVTVIWTIPSSSIKLPVLFSHYSSSAYIYTSPIKNRIGSYHPPNAYSTLYLLYLHLRRNTVCMKLENRFAHITTTIPTTKTTKTIKKAVVDFQRSLR